MSMPLKADGHYLLILHLSSNGDQLIPKYIDPGQVADHSICLAHVNGRELDLQEHLSRRTTILK
jgi:hypothetical protein